MIRAYRFDGEFPWPRNPADYGVRVNHQSVEALFERYQQAGFLYAKKLDRLAPYWSLIMANWRKMLAADRSPLLHHVLATGSAVSEHWSTGAIWLTRPNVVQSHHLASNGNPFASCQVFLAGQALAWDAGAQYAETWYRAENRFPNRFFGGCAAFLGTARAQIGDIALVAMPKTAPLPSDDSIAVHPCTVGDVPALIKLLEGQMGRFLTASECLTAEDISMASVDAVYRSVGLRRYRDVYVARDEISGAVMGAALAHRGPLGTNFSFAENVCRIVPGKSLSEPQRERVLLCLAQAVRATYESFELPYVIVGCDPACSGYFLANGASPLQTYRRLIWSRAGFADWYRYVGEVYERVTSRVRTAVPLEA